MLIGRLDNSAISDNALNRKDISMYSRWLAPKIPLVIMSLLLLIGCEAREIGEMPGDNEALLARCGQLSDRPLYKKGVLGLNFNPAFLNVDDYDNGNEKTQGLTISSFYNVNNVMTPWLPFERDLVARINDLDTVDFANFDAATDVEPLTDTIPMGPPKTVWPNEAVRAPDGVFPFEALVIPQGFMSAGFPGRLTAINLDDPMKSEFLIHQSYQSTDGQDMQNLYDPENSPRFYHRVLFMDMDNDGLKDLVTTRSGLRFGANFYLPLSELVYFKNPGEAIDKDVPWDEVILYNGPPVMGFPPPAEAGLGPDMSLSAHDFEGDGIPEIVATHFFSVPAPPEMPAALAGKIAIYGSPGVNVPWTAVNPFNIRVKDISLDQGYPFDVLITDLNRDGKVDLLATNHQPDNCTPMTSNPYAGRVFAYEQPQSGDIFGGEWTLRVLLDNIVPNPSLPGANPPGRMAPGHAKPFYPVRVLEHFTKPWIVVTGDEASKVWILEPEDLFDSNNWSYKSTVIFDINDHYAAEGGVLPVTQSQIPGTVGVTNSTIGAAAIRYDRPGFFGMAEIYVPAFEAKDIHVFSYRKLPDANPVLPLAGQTAECAGPVGPPTGL